MIQVSKKRATGVRYRTMALAFAAFLFAVPFLTVHAQQNSRPQQQASATQTQSPQAQASSQPQSQPTAKAPAQQPPLAPSKIGTRTDIVTVYATVHDKKGRVLSDLKKDDFAIAEEGKPQPITYFAREDQLPLTVGLLVDTSMSQVNALSDERDASATFVDQTLRTEMKDKAFLIHFDHEVELLQDLTDSHQKLDSALNLLRIERPEEASNNGGQNPNQDPDQRGGSRGYHRGGGTHLYDAIFLASDELMKKQPGRKALIVLSDGVDRGSMESLASSIEAAQRANTVIYSIYFKGEEPSQNFGGHHGGWRMGGPGYGGPGYGGGGGGGPYGGGQRRYPQEQRTDGKKILDRISKETGGQLFEVSKKETVDKIYTQITQELRDQYVMGYLVPNAEIAGYRKITVTTKDKDQIVQARDGYYNEPSSASTSQPKSGAMY
ncbi:MAG TPA: VWA domain-containing protein [Candidatus Acidoferrum sp.]|nr:VWA domain-containing protein [Candidatus Acidoferrum sp.]